MIQPRLDAISREELEEAVESYIAWASDWDGALSADVFFGIWSAFQRSGDTETSVHPHRHNEDKYRRQRAANSRI